MKLTLNWMIERKGSIEQAMNDGWVSADTAGKLTEEVDKSWKATKANPDEAAGRS